MQEIQLSSGLQQVRFWPELLGTAPSVVHDTQVFSIPVLRPGQFV